MNILLLGNGFDLYHKLPTRYDNFLHTIDFLVKNYKPEMKTIADVFGDSRLQNEDDFICECYKTHKIVYENTTLDDGTVEQLINLSKDNLWFRYLLKIFDNKIGWIDFEREVAFVINAFKTFFKKDSINVNIDSLSPIELYIVDEFNFFMTRVALISFNGINNKAKLASLNGTTYRVKDEFAKEYPLGSGVKAIDKEKIIDYLLEQLNILAKILRLYLECFIESTLKGIQQNTLIKCPIISYIDKAISFNYTSSYEQFYLSSEVFHLHGDTKNKIIIGVNPDSSDEVTSIDVSFVKFKKYFQRTQYHTDLDYIYWLKEIDEPKQFTSLIVMGHSLDITDKDILMELFNKMDEIIILYHSEKARNTYISNLINMYGKDGLDNLRKQRGLTFLSLYSDFSDVLKKRYSSSQTQIIKNWVPVF